MLVEDIDFDVDGDGGVDSDGPDGVATINTDYGYDFGGLVGYDFGAFRLEAESSYRNADIDGVAIEGDVGGITPGVYGANGEVDALSFMANALFDFGPDDGLQGFIGAGAGIARVGIEGGDGEDAFVDDSDSGLAWQLLAGVRAPLSENLDVGLRYRMFTAESVGIADFDGSDYDARLRTHSIMGTLIYNFGAPEVVLPPPPQVCETGPYIVFFNWDESDITPEASTILDNAVSAYANCGMASVMLAGHTDTSGSAAYNVGLAERRNASARDYLTARGVPGGRIGSEAFGETQLRVPTADGVRELQNRRVEITYGPGSGM